MRVPRGGFPNPWDMAFVQDLWIGVPWYGVAVSLACVALVRYGLRPLLAKRWPLFRTNAEAPYFALFGAAIFVAGALLLLMSPAAATAAIVAYYILLPAGIVALVSSRRG